jgi:acyl carrier protein
MPVSNSCGNLKIINTNRYKEDKMLDKIKEILAQYVEVELDEVTEDSRLAEDLGLSSFSMMSMMGEFEEVFGITVDETELTEVATIGDIMEYIKKKGGK